MGFWRSCPSTLEGNCLSPPPVPRALIERKQPGWLLLGPNDRPVLICVLRGRGYLGVGQGVGVGEEGWNWGKESQEWKGPQRPPLTLPGGAFQGGIPELSPPPSVLPPKTPGRGFSAPGLVANAAPLNRMGLSADVQNEPSPALTGFFGRQKVCVHLPFLKYQ